MEGMERFSCGSSKTLALTTASQRGQVAANSLLPRGIEPRHLIVSTTRAPTNLRHDGHLTLPGIQDSPDVRLRDCAPRTTRGAQSNWLPHDAHFERFGS